MITFDLSTLVDRPMPEIFSFLSNPLNLPKWQTMVAAIEPVAPGAVGVGSKYKVSAEMLGRKIDGLMEITTFAPPDKFGFTNQAGPMQVTVTVTLKPVGTGAKITLHAEGNPGGLFKLAEGALAGQVKSQMETNLAHLKTVLEAGA
ncbi:MAG: SRPBCC family protein [Chloroflexi bacterium]|nr:SRPBCC family protein [Chloroflexota bacterium]